MMSFVFGLLLFLGGGVGLVMGVATQQLALVGLSLLCASPLGLAMAAFAAGRLSVNYRLQRVDETPPEAPAPRTKSKAKEVIRRHAN